MGWRLVITGAPGSGKTECLERLQNLPQFADFVFLEELARRMLRANPTYRDNWADFHVDLYNQQVAREEELSDRSFISDRGTVDTLAFHPETLNLVNTDLEAEYRRYDTVMQLGTTASLGPQYYIRDEIRREPIEEALVIEEALRKAWISHPGYMFVAADRDFEAKYVALLHGLQKVLGDRIDWT
ncbi:MAG: ATP-binding protein [Candidatus Zixiibacteriota bacterium]|nr:MAG: ATP-binding protein [candidate division Zixibacteria bacterium]